MKFKQDTRRRAAEYEKDIAQQWKKNKTFEKSVEQRPADNAYVFYDGPPFITGMPHHGHLLGSTVKDAVARYWTMKGKRVERKWGWDCHGLPVENFTEKHFGGVVSRKSGGKTDELVLKTENETKDLSLAEYITTAKSLIIDKSEAWEAYVDRIGRWVDFKGAYKTMDKDFMESVWWAFQRLYDAGKIYEGEKVLMYDTKFATPVSKAEVTMDNDAYQTVTDPSVYVKFRLVEDKTEKDLNDYKTIYNYLHIEDKMPEKADAIIVGGAATRNDMAIRAAELYKKGLAPVIVVSGWEHPDFNKNEADILEKTLLENGVPEEAIIKESDASNTGENIRFAELKLLEIGIKPKKIILVHKPAMTRRMKSTAEAQWQGEKPEFFATSINYNFDKYMELEKSRNLFERSLRALLTDFLAFKEYPKLGYMIEKKYPKIVNEAYERLVEKYSSDKDEPKTHLLAWTTTPWTLPGNTALAVNPNFTYAKVEIDGERLIVEKSLVEKVFTDEKHQPLNYKIVGEIKGKDLVGKSYEPLFQIDQTKAKIVNQKGNMENIHKVYAADYVENEAGTGIVHTAPAYGEEDYALAQKHDFIGVDVLDNEGNYLPEMPYAGLEVFANNKLIAKDLKEKNVIWKIEYIQHEYPFNPRSGQRIMYRAVPSWFFDVESQKLLMLAENENINWFPEHIKHGRFAKNIEQAPNWALSRNRFWATAMPVWKGDRGSVKVVGSYDELEKLSGQKLDDYHRPWVDEVEFDLPVKKPIKSFIMGCENIDDDLEKLGIDFTKRNGSLGTYYSAIIPEENLEKYEKLIIEKIKPEFWNEYVNNGEVVFLFKLENGEIERHVWKSEKGERRGRITELVEKFSGSCSGLKSMIEENDFYGKGILEKSTETEHFRRIEEVLDCWFESGSMPFAQLHYPFENKEKFEKNYPADFIVEYVAQVRAWFYYVHTVNTALADIGAFGEMKEKNAFKNCIVTGTLAGNDGRKMSKSLGNYTDPNELMDKYSADSLRFLLLSSPVLAGEDFSLQDKDVGDVARKLSMIWNMYDFFTMYAEVDEWEYDSEKPLTLNPSDVKNPLDKWIISRVHQLAEHLTRHMNEYNIPEACSEVLPFLDDASNWYVRRSRRRFWKSEDDTDKSQAYQTLHYILTQLSLLLAPFTPFLAEELYQNLTGGESVHLLDWATQGEIDEKVLGDMKRAREIIEKSLAIRMNRDDEYGQIKVRQPLSKLTYTGEKLDDFYEQIIKEEVNVKNILYNKNLNIQDSPVYLDKIVTAELKREGQAREIIRVIQNARKDAGLNVGDRIVVKITTDDKELQQAIDEHRETIMSEILATKEADNDGYQTTAKVDGAELTIQLKKEEK